MEQKKKTEQTKKPEQKKKTEQKPKAQPKKKAINYKEVVKKLEEQVATLKVQNLNLEAENQKNLIEFQSLAKNFQKKAQEQINEKNKELAAKVEEEKQLVKKFGSQKLLESIIEPILNIEQAVMAGKNQEAVSAYVMGFEMLLNQLYSELESFGVVSINPKEGSEFDPEVHYAMSQVEGGEKNTIKEVKKKGFKLHERVLKPATVVVYK